MGGLLGVWERERAPVLPNDWDAGYEPAPKKAPVNDWDLGFCDGGEDYAADPYNDWDAGYQEAA